MKTEHTPGPWKFINGGALVQDSKAQLHIGTFSESVGLGKAAEANARLIAAAPELLEALELLLQVCGDYMPAHVTHPAASPCGKARAAIAKAKGE